MVKDVINMFFQNLNQLKKILRIASYPTIQESGRGLHCYQISKLEKFQVIYLTWFNSKAKPFEVPSGVKLYVSKFYNIENPRYASKKLYSIYTDFTEF